VENRSALKELITDTAANRQTIFEWDWMPAEAIKVSKGEQLFPRIESEEKRQKTEKKTEPKKENTECPSRLLPHRAN